ncbi:MAG TPA: TatD family hydrolase, partial [Bacillota bacterium]|nr:TatD family hydrolase [Bacillota bacterium]
MWIDSHAHLNDPDFKDDYHDVIANAVANQVGAIVVVGFDLESSQKAVELAATEPMIWAAVGIHPHDAKNWSPTIATELKILLQRPKVVALGEIGLDYHYNYSPKDEQIQAFRDQLRMAGELQKPVIIHNREAHGDTMTILEETLRETGERKFLASGVMHCFGGSREVAVQCLQLGLLVSFAGPLTFTNAVKLREVASGLPMDKILIETDSPYLSPHPFRGKRNEPGRVGLVGSKLAEIKGISVEEVMQVTTDNCRTLF